MVVRLRSKVDITKEFTKETLPFGQQIGAAWSLIVSESKHIQKSKRLKAEKAKRDRLAREEQLKEVLLLTLHRTLVLNSEWKDQGLETEFVDIAVDRQLKDVYDSVIKYRDFSAYSIEDVPINPDIVASFDNEVPLIFRARKRVIM